MIKLERLVATKAKTCLLMFPAALFLILICLHLSLTNLLENEARSLAGLARFI